MTGGGADKCDGDKMEDCNDRQGSAQKEGTQKRMYFKLVKE